MSPRRNRKRRRQNATPVTPPPAPKGFTGDLVRLRVENPNHPRFNRKAPHVTP